MNILLPSKNDIPQYVIIILTFVCLIIIFSIEPIYQDPKYHFFSDSRNWFGIPNFFNVISNIPFLIIGLWGVFKFLQAKIHNNENIAFLIFSVGIILTGLGSYYYHLEPTSERLVWDRLPMTIAFMSYFSIIISKFFDNKYAFLFLFFFILCGVLSVAYWHIGNFAGEGDLRPYIFIQFYPFLILLIILLFYSKILTAKKYLSFALFFYIVAKVFESLDVEIMHTNSLLSGHSLKHIAACAAAYFIILSGLKNLRRKNKINFYT